MDKQYLKKRHNVWWVRIRIPANAKDILGKTELWKNLKTSDLAEANRKKHKEIGLMHDEIEQAKRNYKGITDKLSKEVQISKYAEYLREAKITSGGDDIDDTSVIKQDLLEGKLDEVYGSKKTDAILHSDDPQWEGQKPNSLAKNNLIESYKISDKSYSPLSLVSKKFLAENTRASRIQVLYESKLILRILSIGLVIETLPRLLKRL
jgi:hypothetical protein